MSPKPNAKRDVVRFAPLAKISGVFREVFGEYHEPVHF